MRLIILCMFLIIVISLALVGDAVGVASSNSKSDPDSISSSEADKGDINVPNLLATKVISLSMASSERNNIVMIGEVALSRAEENLAKLSREVPTPEIIGAEGLTKLYSEIGSAFGISRIPIKFYKYESQLPRSSAEKIPFLGIENLTTLYRDYLERTPQSLPLKEISEGRKDSNNGVSVIWHS